MSTPPELFMMIGLTSPAPSSQSSNAGLVSEGHPISLVPSKTPLSQTQRDLLTSTLNLSH